MPRTAQKSHETKLVSEAGAHPLGFRNGHVARMSVHRWAARMTKWSNSTSWAAQDHRTPLSTPRPMMSKAGRFTRWETELCNFAATQDCADWTTKATSLRTDAWTSLADAFCKYTTKSIAQRMDERCSRGGSGFEPPAFLPTIGSTWVSYLTLPYLQLDTVSVAALFIVNTVSSRHFAQIDEWGLTRVPLSQDA